MIRVPSSSDVMLPDWATPFGGDASYGLSGLGIDWSGIADTIAAGAGGAAQIISVSRTPSVIPGSGGVIYSPATGQVMTNAGVTAQNVGIGFVPIAVIAGIGLLLILTMRK